MLEWFLTVDYFEDTYISFTLFNWKIRIFFIYIIHYFSYRICKRVKFLNWVGIGPDNWLLERDLILFLNISVKEQKNENHLVFTAQLTLLNFLVELELYLKVD